MTIEVDIKTPTDIFPLSKSGKIVGISSRSVRDLGEIGLGFYKVGKLIYVSRSELDAVIKAHPLQMTREQAAAETERTNQKHSPHMDSAENLKNYQTHLLRYKKEQNEGLPTTTAPRACDYSLKTEAELWCVRKIQVQIFGKLLENQETK